MRIKFLSIITGILFVSIAISSCLDSDETYEISTNATVQAFSIDTIHGVKYPFTIDQLNKYIYNVDSLPVDADTIIDKILIDTFFVSGYITAGINDTILNTSDSLNLLPAMNKGKEGMKFTVYAADLVSKNEYTLDIRVHLQDPDSLVWTNMTEPDGEHGIRLTDFPTEPFADNQKSATLGNDLMLYTIREGAVNVYRISTSNNSFYQCESLTVSGLPAADELKIKSLTNFQEKLYLADSNGNVYATEDGAFWSKAEALSGNVLTLTAAFSNTLSAICEEEGIRYFCTTTSDATAWERGNEVPVDFPTENLCTAVYTSATGIEQAVATGMPTGETETIPWLTLTGSDWASLATTSAAYCPALTNPSIIHYNGEFYLFGDGFNAIYSSLTGIAWYEVEEKFMLPEALQGRSNYSVSIDKNHFIWIISGGDDTGTTNQVWRGRLNKLGFENR